MAILFFMLFFPFALFSQFQVGIIGDSISTPYNIEEAYTYYNILQKKYNIDFVNYSVVGSTTQTLIPRLTELLKHDKPDLIIIALGANDALLQLDLKEIENNFQKAISLIKQKNIPLLLGTSDFSEIKFVENQRERIYLKEIVNLYTILKQKNPQIELFSLITPQFTNNLELTLDYTHPNPKGHIVISENLEPLILKYLKPSQNKP